MFALEQNDGSIVLASGGRRIRIEFITAAIARITYTEGKPFTRKASLIVTATSHFGTYSLEEDLTAVTITTPSLRLIIDKQHGAISYFDSTGKLLVREPARGGKWLTPKPVFRNVFTSKEPFSFESTITESVDGARADSSSCESVFDRDAFESRLDFVFSDDEALFGLGSHEEGYGNLRGRSRELYQQNMKAVVPYFISTRGYAVLLDCTSLMTFHDDALGSYWWADVVDELAFYLIQGDTFDEVTRGCHGLTGKAPLPPRWMFGYVQSKERYVNAQELVEVVREYRRRRIPLDAIVLDWKSWPNGAGWGQKSFDPVRFPSPASLTAELHNLGAHLMISIWPIMTGGCEDQRELVQRGLMLGNQSTYDAFNSDARACYWQQAHDGLFVHGVDAWWCDCTEPFEADWSGAVKLEPHARLSTNTAQSKRYLDPGLINAYSLLHSQGIYEGQRRALSTKRVVNLTRSSYAGQHRYGTITWNGDVSANWETLRRTIPEGVNFCATGEPYWTTDIGGFFVANVPNLWFWRGDYNAGCRGLTPGDALEPDPNDTGCTDLGFWELYTRWLQYAVFLPMLRSHGTDAPREIWRFGEEGTRFYDVIASFIRLRYRLLPYTYSLAAQVTFNSQPMLRAVALDFPDDHATHDLLDQFLFGRSLLVCPVTAPMYFESSSQPIADAPKNRLVYLPATCAWFDFWTQQVHPGGQFITVDAPLERIPLFVRAGSIIPMSAPIQHTCELPEAALELQVYSGADTHFTLYEDAGDGYAYEDGEYAMIHLTWTEALQQLTFSPRQGDFPGLVREREFTIVFLAAASRHVTSVRYTGQGITIRNMRASEPGIQEPHGHS
jgi:alpha-D-xyloside xylohydrolase